MVGFPTEMTMQRWWIGAAILAVALGAGGLACAQEPVVGAADADALFTSPDPKLNANKQIAYHIQKDLLEANHWDEAGKWLSDRYLQHNPNAASGLKGVIDYFTQVRKVQPKPIAAKVTTPIVAVIAEGDLVTIVRPYVVKDPSKSYTTTWFDTWRIVNGKADEHWDSALKN
jgi:predicted SnoaL-like aldol condensation-catalyzing enzyme